MNDASFCDSMNVGKTKEKTWIQRAFEALSQHRQGLTCTDEVLWDQTPSSRFSLPLEVTMHQKSPSHEGEEQHCALTSSYHLSRCKFSSLLADV